MPHYTAGQLGHFQSDFHCYFTFHSKLYNKVIWKNRIGICSRKYILKYTWSSINDIRTCKLRKVNYIFRQVENSCQSTRLLTCLLDNQQPSKLNRSVSLLHCWICDLIKLTIQHHGTMVIRMIVLEISSLLSCKILQFKVKTIRRSTFAFNSVSIIWTSEYRYYIKRNW